MNNYLIDTNIITALLKNNVAVADKIENVLLQGAQIFINGISYYEIKRGLLAAGANSKITLFERFCSELGTVWLGEQTIFDRAADIYSRLKKVGKMVEDADILIAATAVTYDLTLVSDDADFQKVGNLKLENWLAN
ncbi:MAG: PIN domain-containing protein [Chloroflexi bacterium]|nr:PIN domain-containing protein [Chloroflexota bacterium]